LNPSYPSMPLNYIINKIMCFCSRVELHLMSAVGVENRSVRAKLAAL
jgi:hypothetical protein